MILVNEVASSSTDGAIDSTVIARISVIALLGLPPPTLMLTVPSSTAGAVGSAGAAGSVGAACAIPASRQHGHGAQHREQQDEDDPPQPRAAGGAVRRDGGRHRRTVRSRSPLHQRAPAGLVEDRAGQRTGRAPRGHGSGPRSGAVRPSAVPLGGGVQAGRTALGERRLDGLRVHLGQQGDVLLGGARRPAPRRRCGRR